MFSLEELRARRAALDKSSDELFAHADKVIAHSDEVIKNADNSLARADKTLDNMQQIIDETQRVADVAAHSREILDDLEAEFERRTGLTKIDIAFLFVAVGLQVARQYLLTSFPERLDDQTAAQQTLGHREEHSDRVHRYYNPSLEEIITNPVPFDASDGANGALAGGGFMGHRVTALGHDPILGFLFGTSNIATSTLTNHRMQSFHITTGARGRDAFGNHANTALVLSSTGDKLLRQGMEGKKIVGTSLVKEAIHLSSDLYTKHSLPIPILSVANPALATSLAGYGVDMANVVTVGKQALFAALINALITMVHRLLCSETDAMNIKLYEVRTRKILSYSNLIATTSNVLYVGLKTATGNAAAVRRLDLGGLLVTIHRLYKDKKFIRDLKHEFVYGSFNEMIRGKKYDFE